MLSIIIRPFSLSIDKQFLLSMTVAIGVHTFFSKYAGDQTKIKWPNDLYWNDRKAGGILIENQVQGHVWKHAVVGIGININQINFHPSAGNAVSLKQVTGREWNIIDAAKELVQHLNSELTVLLDAPGDVTKRYHQALYKWNEVQEFRINEKTFTAKVDGVTEEGYLVATHNRKEYFKTGELEWIIT
jgi:BirA family biotin operon repressor/biotin-[acetyl-CoA-carboxylase] ligase